MEVEASADDVDALHNASLTNFNAGDVVCKLMALIAQLCACGVDTRDYLKKFGKMQGFPEWEIKLWIQTCWGSLSDCFDVVLMLQKVCISCKMSSIISSDTSFFWSGSWSILLICQHRRWPSTPCIRQEMGWLSVDSIWMAHYSTGIWLSHLSCCHYSFFSIKTSLIVLNPRLLQLFMVNSWQAQCQQVIKCFPCWRSFNQSGKTFLQKMNTNQYTMH